MDKVEKSGGQTRNDVENCCCYLMYVTLLKIARGGSAPRHQSLPVPVGGSGNTDAGEDEVLRKRSR
eukprot:15796973-Heterocapsa_arctica.AAC.1